MLNSCRVNKTLPKQNILNSHADMSLRLCLLCSLSRQQSAILPTTKNQNIVPQMKSNSSLMGTMTTKHSIYQHLDYILLMEEAEFMQTALTNGCECTENLKTVVCLNRKQDKLQEADSYILSAADTSKNNRYHTDN